MKIHEHAWNPSKSLIFVVKFNGNIYIYMKIRKNQWKSMRIDENHRKSMRIAWKSIKIRENKRKSIKWPPESFGQPQSPGNPREPPACPWRIPTNHREARRASKNPREPPGAPGIDQNPWKSIKSMKSIKIHEIYANLWNLFKSVKMHQNPSKSSLIYGNLRKSVKIRENLWNVWNEQKSLKRYENNEIDQNLPKSKKSMAYPSNVLRIVYGFGFPLIRTLRSAFQTSGDGSRVGG